MPRRKKNVIRLDFSGVGSRTVVPEGDYNVTIKSVEQKEGKEYPYLAWVLSISDGQYKGKPLYINTSLSPAALWNLKTLLEALGVEVPDSVVDLDLEDVVDLPLRVTVEHEVYEGKNKAKVVDFAPADDDTDEEEEEEAPKKAGASANGSKKSTVSQDEIDDMDQDELEEFIEENSLDLDLGTFKTLRKMRAAVIDAAESAGIME